MKLKKILSTLMCTAALMLSMTSCGHVSSSSSSAEKTTNITAADQSSFTESQNKSQKSLGKSGTFTIALYSEYAPETCENFEKLVKDGFYSSTVFHRVIEDFMAQGGGFDKNGNQKETSTINGEFKNNGFTKNTLSHTRGVVSMARTQVMNSASSQFFICYSDKDTFLDGNYAAFGKITDGMDVVDDFLKVERKIQGEQQPSVPVTPIVIVKAEMIENDKDGHHQAKFYVEF